MRFELGSEDGHVLNSHWIVKLDEIVIVNANFLDHIYIDRNLFGLFIVAVHI